MPLPSLVPTPFSKPQPPPKDRPIIVTWAAAASKPGTWVEPGWPFQSDQPAGETRTERVKVSSTGVHAIVYFVGQGNDRIAVALRPLGDGALKSSTGIVVKLSRKDHLLTIKNSDGAEETYRLDPKTVADTENGVVTGSKYNLPKGDSAHVTAAPTDGNARSGLTHRAGDVVGA